jgi:hypothetical protein
MNQGKLSNRVMEQAPRGAREHQRAGSPATCRSAAWMSMNNSHVINYDLPDDPEETHVHRHPAAPRARASGKDGIAWGRLSQHPIRAICLRRIEMTHQRRKSPRRSFQRLSAGPGILRISPPSRARAAARSEQILGLSKARVPSPPPAHRGRQRCQQVPRRNGPHQRGIRESMGGRLRSRRR